MSNYDNEYHVWVAQADFGIYNWKQHSTGYLIKWMRDVIRYTGWCDYWANEWRERIRDELAKRPHISNKRERKKQRLGRRTRH